MLTIVCKITQNCKEYSRLYGINNIKIKNDILSRVKLQTKIGAIKRQKCFEF